MLATSPTVMHLPLIRPLLLPFQPITNLPPHMGDGKGGDISGGRPQFLTLFIVTP